MARPVLDASHVHASIRDQVASFHRDIIDEVERAVGSHDVVVVGMRQNPFPRKARALLKERGIAFEYLEYGSYLGEWRRRSALKMWTGWPTFPMIFIKGLLIGGFTELKALAESGELDALRSADRAA